MSQLNNIKRLHSVIDASLFRITGKLDYARLTDASIALANAVHAFNGDSDELWSIGEFDACSLSDFIVGAYWHFTEWHAGMRSPSYAALCALGQVFNPGMTSVETDNETYRALNELAENN